MTGTIRERILNMGISALTAGGAVVLAFALSSGEGKQVRVDKELKEKADIEYVDQQDLALEKDLDDYKAEHVLTHSLDAQSIRDLMNTNFDAQDEKLDVIIRWIESEHGE